MIFIPLNKDDDKQCRSFEEMMDAYTLELDEHLGKNTPREVIGRWVKSIIEKQGAADRHLELCWEENEPVGFLFGKVDHPEHRGYIRPGWGYVMEFYVRPEYRRRGYGQTMCGHLEKLFRRDGVRDVYLTADPVTGKPFWLAMGYRDTGEKSPDNKQEIFEKQLV